MFQGILRGKNIAALVLAAGGFVITGQQDCDSGGEDGLVEPFNYNGYNGHLIHGYNTSDAPEAADYLCQMEGYSAAVDYNLGKATPDPVACWCIQADGRVTSPCCWGDSPVEIDVFDGPVSCTY